MDWITWIWLGLGIAALVAELLLPGLVIVFLGSAAILVAGLRALGLIESLTASLFVWMGLSVGLTLSLRSFFLKRLPGESRRAITEESIQAFGEEVVVLDAVNDQDSSGRIRYQGTTWPAVSTNGSIPAGGRARLVARQNLAWLVEPVLAGELSEKNGD